jgi:hypothetical protein
LFTRGRHFARTEARSGAVARHRPRLNAGHRRRT